MHASHWSSVSGMPFVMLRLSHMVARTQVHWVKISQLNH